MEKHRFVCSNCGAEYWLQAWKAVCPKCMQEFTLELRELKYSSGVVKSNKISAAFMAGYAVYGLLTPGQGTLFDHLGFVPSPLLAGLILLAALLVYSGSEPITYAAAVVGFSAAFLHLLQPTFTGFAGIILGLGSALTALTYLRHMRQHRKHIDKEADARTMPEYSGWAGSPKNA